MALVKVSIRTTGRMNAQNAKAGGIMKIMQLTKREFFLYTLFISLLTSIITISINKRPIIINAVYKYDGNLDFKNKRITYNLEN